MPDERCAWCGVAVEAHDGYRLAEGAGERRAAFCRLEHVVPWAMRGAHWEPGSPVEPPALGDALSTCAQCGEPLADASLLIVRHRGEHRIPDAFCSVGHVADWVKGGGRWRAPAR